MIPLYQQMMGPEDYEACVKSGAAVALVEISRHDPEMAKIAQDIGSAVSSLSQLGDYSTKLLLTASILTGVPVGIMMHALGKKLTERRAKEKQLTGDIDYYRNASRGLESEMARQGIKISAADALRMVKGGQHLGTTPASPMPSGQQNTVANILNIKPQPQSVIPGQPGTPGGVVPKVQTPANAPLTMSKNNAARPSELEELRKLEAELKRLKKMKAKMATSGLPEVPEKGTSQTTVAAGTIPDGRGSGVGQAA